MRYAKLIYVLLVIKALILVHFILQFPPGVPTGHVIEAQGGVVTLANVYPTHRWGGIWGMLNESGNTSFTIDAQTIHEANVYQENSTCNTTEIIASSSQIAASTITPVHPNVADSLLGINPSDAHSITRLFTDQYVFNIGGTTKTYWGTATHGTGRDYAQGVAISGSQIVFIAQTYNSGRSYAGEHAHFQMLLPNGTWYFTTDTADRCDVSGNPFAPIETPVQTGLQAALPMTLCSNQVHIAYVVRTENRLYCAAERVPSPGCSPLADVDVTLKHYSDELSEQQSDDNGAFTIPALDSGTYTLILQSSNATTYKTFRIIDCIQGSAGEPDRNWTITLPKPVVDLTDIIFGGTPPREEKPLELTKTQESELVIIATLTISIVFLLLYGYYRTHKETSTILLKLRIWLLERFG